MFNYIRRIIIRWLIPVNKFLGHLYLAPKARWLRASDITTMQAMLCRGDVLISFSRGEATNPFIAGPYKHSAIYVGCGEIVEAIGKGVSIKRFEDFCASKDSVYACRPTFCDLKAMEKAADFAVSEIGKPYDYMFEPTEDAFYCSELVAEAYNVAMNGKSPFVPRTILGAQTVLPSDFFFARSKFATVFERPLQPLDESRIL